MIKTISTVEFRFHQQIIRFIVDVPFYPEGLNYNAIIEGHLSKVQEYLDAKKNIRYVRFLGLTDIVIGEIKFLVNCTIDFRNGKETISWLVKDDGRVGDDLMFDAWRRDIEPIMIGTARSILSDFHIKICCHLREHVERLRKAADRVEALLET